MLEPLHVRRFGAGNRILFLHGSTGKAGSMWEPQHSLADRFELVMPDRRGWGGSPPGMVDDLEVQIEELASLLGEKAHLVGFSYGAMLALLIAGRYPEKIRSLLLHEPPVFQLAEGEEHVEQQIAMLQYAFEITPDGDPAEFRFRFLAATGAPQSQPTPLQPEQIPSVVRMMQEPNPVGVPIPLGAARAAGFPKLVFSGQSLPSLTVLCRSLARQIDATLIEIPEASHGVRHPGLTQALDEFVTSASASA